MGGAEAVVKEAAVGRRDLSAEEVEDTSGEQESFDKDGHSHHFRLI